MMPNSMFLGLAYAFAVMALMAILLRKGRMQRKVAIAISITTVLVAGILLGGVPDPVTQYMQIFRGLSVGKAPVVPLFGLLLLTALALVTGRLFCGHACPVGAAQELMSRVTKRKVDIERFRPRLVRAAFTVIMGLAAVATPFILSANPFRFFELQFALVTTAVFLAILAVSVVVYRPWCRLLCPFGAISELASRRSVLSLRREASCNNCGRCMKACPTAQFSSDSTMSECYLCGRCIDACRKDCLAFGRRKR